MLLFAVCLFLISKAFSFLQSADAYNDIVAGVNDTLDECLALADDVGNHVNAIPSQDDVRRAEQDSDVDVLFGACASIIDAVDTYRINHNRHLLLNFLDWPGNAGLNVLLGSVNKKMGELLYVASRDGDHSSQFHAACDNKGPTLVVVQSTNGAVFGGYTGVGWTTSGSWAADAYSFLFQLRPSFKKYSNENSNYAVLHYADYGPCFGFGHDLVIYNNPLSNYDSYTNGNSYEKINGQDYSINDGKRNFKVLDYFVVKAI